MDYDFSPDTQKIMTLKQDFKPAKRCQNCFSVFINDDECEFCGMKFKNHHLGQPFFAQSYFGLSEDFYLILPWWAKLFGIKSMSKHHPKMEFWIRQCKNRLYIISKNFPTLTDNNKDKDIEIYLMESETLLYELLPLVSHASLEEFINKSLHASLLTDFLSKKLNMELQAEKRIDRQMKFIWINVGFIFIFLAFFSLFSNKLFAKESPLVSDRSCYTLIKDMTCYRYPFIPTSIRVGVFKEDEAVSFKGNIFYLPGIGDSILNHQRLFNYLSKLGFRIISFDYPGQGGSQGKISSVKMTEVVDLIQPLYKNFSRHTNEESMPILIGWSYGGVVAYMASLQNISKQIILIAPTFKLASSSSVHAKISLDMLTSAAPYLKNDFNPHLEPVSFDHFYSAEYPEINKKIPADVKGAVMNSGPNDMILDHKKLIIFLKDFAPQLKQISFPESKHEIDNEKGPIAHALNVSVGSEIIKMLPAKLQAQNHY